MYNHEPENYRCPFCLVTQGIEGDFPYTKQADIVYRDNHVVAIIASHWWPNNKGHVIIYPQTHVENVYSISDEDLAAVNLLAKKIALAFKATYNCDGVSTRQHNEPAGDQDVWHFHMHVFPRYEGDNLYGTTLYKSDPEERIAYAKRIGEFLVINS